MLQICSLNLSVVFWLGYILSIYQEFLSWDPSASGFANPLKWHANGISTFLRGLQCSDFHTGPVTWEWLGATTALYLLLTLTVPYRTTSAGKPSKFLKASLTSLHCSFSKVRHPEAQPSIARGFQVVSLVWILIHKCIPGFLHISYICDQKDSTIL